MTTELTDALERHYIKPGDALPGGVFVREVGGNGSFGAARRCDAVYVGFTNTSGRLLVGHEVKVSRADWLHELDQLHKADTWADQCHAWYLVTPDPSIVQIGELPPGWGHMVPPRTGRRFKILERAQIHRDRTPSWDTVRSMFARIDSITARRILDERQLASQAADRRYQERLDERRKATEDPVLRRKADDLDTICAAIGVDASAGGWLTLDGAYLTPEIFRAAVAVLKSDQGLRNWTAQAKQLAEIAATMHAARAELDQLPPLTEGTQR